MKSIFYTGDTAVTDEQAVKKANERGHVYFSLGHIQYIHDNFVCEQFHNIDPHDLYAILNLRTVTDGCQSAKARKIVYITSSVLLEVLKGISVEPWMYFVNIKESDFSSIEEVIAELDSNSPVEVYNLNGVKVADTLYSLPSGLYIVSQSKTVKKVAVK